MTKTNTVIENDTKLKTPGMYAVLIHNDEITTMEYVVEVLVEIFHKSVTDAAALMMEVHEKGQGIAGVYVFDIAATKKSQADLRSAERGFPLRLTIREVEA
ncbi:MAG: ATP-dependent Clp protease adaptor ClpS [Defluviitaleaceae bacterium]|nr:ATP-dependent Clp protease adaptor ClpS [Defluviitaleaceae bacterium]MCL2217778.1 ATP-dependent Clp protease adaptor ClpS [Defluviitaleaceae bacterium]